MRASWSDQCARVQGDGKYGFRLKKLLQHNRFAFEFPFAWVLVQKCLSKRLVIHSDVMSLSLACCDILTSPCSLCVQCCRLTCRHDSSGRRHHRAFHQAQAISEEHANQRPAVPRWVSPSLHCSWTDFLAGKMGPTVTRFVLCCFRVTPSAPYPALSSYTWPAGPTPTPASFLPAKPRSARHAGKTQLPP